jgi:hypothetical protein
MDITDLIILLAEAEVKRGIYTDIFKAVEYFTNYFGKV